MSLTSTDGTATDSVPAETDDLSYPRPQFRRKRWLSLDGSWSFAVTAERLPSAVRWDRQIEVPYPPESRMSGLDLDAELPVVWYRRAFTVPEEWRSERLLLHFGAVDYRAEVWLNGHRAGAHEGGYTPFTLDITELLDDDPQQELSVRVEDPPAAFDVPRGKQDWKPQAHSIWYPRTTGIWQPVWLEPVPQTHLARARITPDVHDFSVELELEIAGDVEGVELEIELGHEGERLWGSSVALRSGRLRHTIHLADPGIDDARNELLWSPERPTLLDLTISLSRGSTQLDRVESYTGLRSVEVRQGRFYLNGRPYFQRLVLDQGYWNESLLAAPSPQALRADVELAKAMGFNGVRKHQKLEDPRYLYWADRLGLLVWNELPSAYTFSAASSGRLLDGVREAVARDYNHPCVVAWVPFNESWGVPELPRSPRQRDLVAALYHLVRALDGSRVVIDNDGWEHGDTDLFTIHDYAHDPKELAARYGDRERLLASGLRHRPGGRSLSLGDAGPPEAVLISEFGGVRFGNDSIGWGYSEAGSPAELLERLGSLVAVLAGSSAVIGYCYTQFADTFQEQNGLLYSDRRPKVPLASLAEVFTKGGRG